MATHGRIGSLNAEFVPNILSYSEDGPMFALMVALFSLMVPWLL
jgi:hypothetical protein